jgi:hypothetical protein
MLSMQRQRLHDAHIYIVIGYIHTLYWDGTVCISPCSPSSTCISLCKKLHAAGPQQCNQ